MHKFPFYLQHDSMQCGIACLQMICKYFGREYSLDSLSNLCFATAEGVSLLGINETANMLGLHTTCARATTIALSDVPLPCILHWNQNHFVVLYKVKKEKTCKDYEICRIPKQVCNRDIVRKYSEKHWDYPDVNCPKCL